MLWDLDYEDHEARFLAEVAGWLDAAGFQGVEHVDWCGMAAANQDNYRRNTGVPGRRSIAATPDEKSARVSRLRT